MPRVHLQAYSYWQQCCMPLLVWMSNKRRTSGNRNKPWRAGPGWEANSNDASHSLVREIVVSGPLFYPLLFSLPCFVTHTAHTCRLAACTLRVLLFMVAAEQRIRANHCHCYGSWFYFNFQCSGRWIRTRAARIVHDAFSAIKKCDNIPHASQCGDVWRFHSPVSINIFIFWLTHNIRTCFPSIRFDQQLHQWRTEWVMGIGHMSARSTRPSHTVQLESDLNKKL